MAIDISKNNSGDLTYDNQPEVNRVMFPNITVEASFEEIQRAVNAWLEDHPEVTTTVEDGSLLPPKFDSENEPSDGYVLSWNATAEKFEWVNIQDDITEIKQSIIKNEVVAPNCMFIDMPSKKTHEGLVVYPRVSIPSNMFSVVCTESGWLNPDIDKYCTRIELHVPPKYSRKWQPIYKTLKANEIRELTIDNDTFNSVTLTSPGVLSYNLALNTSRTSMFVSNGEPVNYYMFKAGIRLYDDDHNVERIIYPLQVIYAKGENDSVIVTETIYKNDNDYDVLAVGKITSPLLGSNFPNIINNQSIVNAESTPNLFWNKVIGNLLDGVPGSSTALIDAHRLLAWESMDDTTNDTICVSFITGDNKKFISGGYTLFIKPSTTMTQAVSAGDTFMLDELWYKATTDLAIGDTLDAGTNCEAIDDPVIPTEELPTVPTTDGTYHLEVSVASGVPTMTWVANT